jgi:hypothetical protein
MPLIDLRVIFIFSLTIMLGLSFTKEYEKKVISIVISI